MFFPPFNFGNILGLWTPQPLDPDTPDRVRDEPNFLAWVSVLASPWLATPTVFVSLSPAHRIGSTGHRLCGLVGDPILPLVVLPDHRTWPDQAAYPLLLGVLFGAGVLVVDFWEFPVIRFLPNHEMTPFSVSFQFSSS